MLEYLETTFNIPFIFVILCYALGTAVFIGAGQWSRSIARGTYHGQALWRGIGAWMARAWVWVIIFSLSVQIGLWPEYRPDNPSYLAEVLILAMVVMLFVLFKRKRAGQAGFVKGLKSEAAKMAQYIGIAALIWGVTISIFLLITILSVYLMRIAPFLEGVLDPSRDAAMVLGVVWLFPFIDWYQKGSRLEHVENTKTPEHYKFYMLLWPIVIGLFFFIMPLFAQKLVTSEKFQEMLDAKPPLERV